MLLTRVSGGVAACKRMQVYVLLGMQAAAAIAAAAAAAAVPYLLASYPACSMHNGPSQHDILNLIAVLALLLLSKGCIKEFVMFCFKCASGAKALHIHSAQGAQYALVQMQRCVSRCLCWLADSNSRVLHRCCCCLVAAGC
jgi:hypothetical protein